MPDIKHNFTSGKMNKDLDERLVPNGEYRDAHNIEVSSSENSEVGTVQNILGNFDGCIDKDGNNLWSIHQLTAEGSYTPSFTLAPNYNPIPMGGSTVGSVSDEKNDTLYWLVAGSQIPTPDPNVTLTAPMYSQDMILRKTPTTCEPVFVDQWAFAVSNVDAQGGYTNSSNDNIIYLNDPAWLDEVHVGMTVQGLSCDDPTGNVSNISTIVGIGAISELTAPYYGTYNFPPAVVNTFQTPGYLEIEPPVLNPITGQYSPPLNAAQVMSGANNGESVIYVEEIMLTGQTIPSVGDPIWTGDYDNQGSLLSTGQGTNTTATTISSITGPHTLCQDGGVGCKQMYRIVADQPLQLGADNANPAPFNLQRDANSVRADYLTCTSPAPNNACAYMSLVPNNLNWGNATQPPQAVGNIVPNTVKVHFTTTTQPPSTVSNTITLPQNSPILNEIYDTINNGNTVFIAPGYGFPTVVPATQSTDACIDPASVSAPVPDPITGLLVYDNTFNLVYCPGTTGNVLNVPYYPLFPYGIASGNITLLSNYAQTAIHLDHNLDLTINQGQVCNLIFRSERVLNFEPSKLVTGLNIFDDMLFWVDGIGITGSEPKKINISRSIKGTDPSGRRHTRLINDALNYGLATTPNIPIVEDHITVIRKSPKKALTLEVNTDRIPGKNYGGIIRTTNDLSIANVQTVNRSSILGSSKGFIQNFKDIQPNDEVMLLINTEENAPYSTNFRLPWDVGDTVVLHEFVLDGVNPQGVPPTYPFSYRIKAEIMAWPYMGLDSFGLGTNPGNWGVWSTPMNSNITTPFSAPPFIGPSTGASNDTWHDGTHTAAKGTARVKLRIIDVDGVPPVLEDPNGLPTYLDYVITLASDEEKIFKSKLPRFSYRYRYEDGEYSTFAPFTQVAFLPSGFDYHPTEGYNIGMTNKANNIVLKDYITNDMPEDVVAVDILYKEDISANVYVVDTIEPLDNKVASSGNPTFNNWQSNSYKITKDTIKSILPENQLLRPWDNVPLKAQSQEITANRIVYGNYIQNFDLIAGNLTGASGKPMNYQPTFNTSLQGSLQDVAPGTPLKSIKSLREYQLGVVFVDRYGRETPVISNETGTIEIEKSKAIQANKFKVSFADNDIPPGLKYFKFFVKETAGEYYNLAMGRWYDADDGNVWLTFPSSDRNKIDIDSYLILKKGPDSTDLVKDEARYKVLAIENEAPDWVKTKQILVDEHQIDSGAVDILQGNTLSNTSVPVEGGRKLILMLATGNQNSALNTSTGANLDKIRDGSTIWIEFGRQGMTGRSKRYRITEITKNNLDDPATTPDRYFVTVENQFGTDVNFLSDGSQIHRDTWVYIYKYIPENNPQYDGRFWAKIKSDAIFKQNVIKSFSEADTEYNSAFSQKIYKISNNIVADHDKQSTNSSTIYNNQVSLSLFLQTIPGSLHQGSLNQYYYTWAYVSPWITSVANTLSMDKLKTWVYNMYYGYDNEYANDPNSPVNEIGLFRVSDEFNPRITSSNYTDLAGRGGETIAHESYWTIDESSFIGTLGGNWDGGNDLFPGSMSPSGVYNDAQGSTGSSAGPAAQYLLGGGGNDGVNNVYSDRSVIDLTFGGILPAGTFSHTSDPSNLHYNYAVKENFFDLSVNPNHTDQGAMLDFVYPSNQFKWKQDPNREVYTIKSNMQKANGLRYSDKNYYLANRSALADVLTMYQHPANFAKRFKFGVEPQISVWQPTVAGAGGIIGEGAGFEVAGTARVTPQACDCATGATGGPVANHIKNNTAVGPYPHNLPDLTICVDSIVNPSTGNVFGNDGNVRITADQTWGLVAGGGAAGNGGTILPFVSNPDPQDAFVVKEITVNTAGVYELKLAGYRRAIDITDDLPAGVLNLITGELTFVQLTMNGLSPKSAEYLGTVYQCPGCIAAVGYDIEFLQTIQPTEVLAENPAVWETEPKETLDLEIYHEISDLNAVALDPTTIKTIFPVGSEVQAADGSESIITNPPTTIISNTVSPSGDTITLSQVPCYPGNVNPLCTGPSFLWSPPDSHKLKVIRPNGTEIIVSVSAMGVGGNIDPDVKLDTNLYGAAEYVLDYHNCYSFLNGVESNRIRDGFNLPFITNGVKASSSLGDKYEQEHRKYGLIYSGIYNSKSGINNLNQFIQAEKITKDINPNYGSIQKLHTRDTDLVTLCEDKVLKILSNKDAVFNADGNTNLTATENVLGQTIPFIGEYGISKNPESFTSESYRAYFTDKIRGSVMRLSKDGLTPISDHGMRDWFRDNLKLSNKLIGSYDDRKNEYNITLDQGNPNNSTVTFKENSKGWVSFKSFIPENGISCANSYYTFLNGNIWKHHNEDNQANRNEFYGVQYQSSFKVIFNDEPGSVKNFKTVNYEGSHTRVRQFRTHTMTDVFGVTTTYNDNRYDNLVNVPGWWLQKIETDLQQGGIPEFIQKEGKWFNYIKGPAFGDDARPQFDEFAAQGVGGYVNYNPNVEIIGCTDQSASNYNPLAIVPCEDINGTPNGTATTYTVFNPSVDCCDPCHNGCTDPTAFNYNAGATCDDGSCQYMGCMDPNALNYDPNATMDNGSCTYPNPGCMDNSQVLGENASGGNGGGPTGVLVPVYTNYDSTATCDCTGNCNATPPGDNSCCIPAIYGCMDPAAINYDPMYNVSSSVPCTSVILPSGLLHWNQNYCSCLPDVIGCTDSNALNFNQFATIPCNVNYSAQGNNQCCTYPPGPQIQGCTDPAATNYNAAATVDDGSCIYTATTYPGCTDPAATNYVAGCIADPNCYSDNSLCVYCIFGCMDDGQGGAIPGLQFPNRPLNWSGPATNYDPNATCNSGCTYSNQGCTCGGGDPANYPNINPPVGQLNALGFYNDCGNNGYPALNFDPLATVDDGSCEVTVIGCLDPNASNFAGFPVGAATIDDGSCLYPGCTDPTATNYNPNANADDGSCIYPCTQIGCMDPTACNYDATACINDSTLCDFCRPCQCKDGGGGCDCDGDAWISQPTIFEFDYGTQSVTTPSGANLAAIIADANKAAFQYYAADSAQNGTDIYNYRYKLRDNQYLVGRNPCHAKTIDPVTGVTTFEKGLIDSRWAGSGNNGKPIAFCCKTCDKLEKTNDFYSMKLSGYDSRSWVHKQSNWRGPIYGTNPGEHHTGTFPTGQKGIGVSFTPGIDQQNGQYYKPNIGGNPLGGGACLEPDGQMRVGPWPAAGLQLDQTLGCFTAPGMSSSYDNWQAVLADLIALPQFGQQYIGTSTFQIQNQMFPLMQACDINLFVLNGNNWFHSGMNLGVPKPDPVTGLPGHIDNTDYITQSCTGTGTTIDPFVYPPGYKDNAAIAMEKWSRAWSYGTAGTPGTNTGTEFVLTAGSLIAVGTKSYPCSCDMCQEMWVTEITPNPFNPQQNLIQSSWQYYTGTPYSTVSFQTIPNIPANPFNPISGLYGNGYGNDPANPNVSCSPNWVV